jgi:hypothetical protein
LIAATAKVDGVCVLKLLLNVDVVGKIVTRGGSWAFLVDFVQGLRGGGVGQRRVDVLLLGDVAESGELGNAVCEALSGEESALLHWHTGGGLMPTDWSLAKDMVEASVKDDVGRERTAAVLGCARTMELRNILLQQERRAASITADMRKNVALAKRMSEGTRSVGTPAGLLDVAGSIRNLELEIAESVSILGQAEWAATRVVHDGPYAEYLAFCVERMLVLPKVYTAASLLGAFLALRPAEESRGVATSSVELCVRRLAVLHRVGVKGPSLLTGKPAANVIEGLEKALDAGISLRQTLVQLSKWLQSARLDESAIAAMHEMPASRESWRDVLSGLMIDWANCQSVSVADAAKVKTLEGECSRAGALVPRNSAPLVELPRCLDRLGKEGLARLFGIEVEGEGEMVCSSLLVLAGGEGEGRDDVRASLGPSVQALCGAFRGQRECVVGPRDVLEKAGRASGGSRATEHVELVSRGAAIGVLEKFHDSTPAGEMVVEGRINHGFGGHGPVVKGGAFRPRRTVTVGRGSRIW